MTQWLLANDVSKTFRRTRGDGVPVEAIHSINLSVDEGTFVTLVGPSGCGKTTFLRILDGLIKPTSGEVLLKGRAITSTSSDRSMVFQDASLFPWYTVLRNVAYGLECAGVSKAKAMSMATPYVRTVGLEGFEHAYPHELSGGMQQRANLARALAVDPAVLLMDEPFAALDSQTREFMQTELLTIWQATRKTVVFITHQIDEAVYLSDRVIVMSPRPGRVLAEISIDIPRPRPVDVKRSPQFHEYEDHIWALLHTRATETGGHDLSSTGMRP